MTLGLYILASAVILASAATAVAYFLSKGVRHVSTVPENLACEARKVTEVLAGTAGTLGEATIQRTAGLVQPVSDGIGNVLHSIAGCISTKQKELAEFRNKVLTLTQEIDAVKARHISIDRVKSILKLALIEADFTLHNIKKIQVGGKDGKFYEQDEEIEYLGIIKATYKQRLGVDLEKLSFQIDRASPSTIAVAGLGQTELIGTNAIGILPIHTELRRCLKKSKFKSEQKEILPGDDEKRTANDQERKQNYEIFTEINASNTTKEIDDAIDKLAFSFLQMCFAPAHYTLIRATEPLEKPKSFSTIAAEINAEFQKQIIDHKHPVIC